MWFHLSEKSLGCLYNDPDLNPITRMQACPCLNIYPFTERCTLTGGLVKDLKPIHNHEKIIRFQGESSVLASM